LQQQKEQQRLERLAQQEKAGVQAMAGLKQVQELRQQYRFVAAATMLTQVRGWAEQAVDGELDAEVEQVQADLDLARDLDDVRQKAALLVDGKWDSGSGRALYPTVLEQHGLNVLEGDTDELVKRIRESALCQTIIAALDDWARSETDAQKERRLLRVANSAEEPARGGKRCVRPWPKTIESACVSSRAGRDKGS
jgi:hypothetical protein